MSRDDKNCYRLNMYLYEVALGRSYTVPIHDLREKLEVMKSQKQLGADATSAAAVWVPR
jgi:hypothetical protein